MMNKAAGRSRNDITLEQKADVIRGIEARERRTSPDNLLFLALHLKQFWITLIK
jgi:hypothetical protein